MHKAYKKNLLKTFVYHSAGHTTDPYQADVQRFVNEYKDDKLCHTRHGRHHIGYEDFKLRITAENPTKVIEKQSTGTGAIKRQIPLLKPKQEINKYHK